MSRLSLLLLCLSLSILTQRKSADDIKAAVTRMARVGRCGSPSFSPDGKNFAVVCDMSGRSANQRQEEMTAGHARRGTKHSRTDSDSQPKCFRSLANSAGLLQVLSSTG